MMSKLPIEYSFNDHGIVFNVSIVIPSKWLGGS